MPQSIATHNSLNYAALKMVDYIPKWLIVTPALALKS